MNPESQPQAIERQLNLVEEANFNVEIIYFEDRSELEDAPALIDSIEAQMNQPAAEAGNVALVDLIDFTGPELAAIAAEPLYVWPGDAQTTAASDDLAPASASQHDTLQSDAQAWELAA